MTDVVTAGPPALTRAVTPLHEGFHVAAAWILAGDEAIRGAISCVESGLDGLVLGFAHVGVPLPSSLARREAWVSSLGGLPAPSWVRDAIEVESMILLAGYVGEAHGKENGRLTEIETTPSAEYLARQDAAIERGDVMPESDLETVKKLLAEVVADPVECADWYRLLVTRTYNLTRHPLFWPIATAIGHELGRYQEITADKAIRTCHYVADPPAEPHPATAGYYK